MNNFMIVVSMVGFAFSFIIGDVVKLVFFGVMYLSYKMNTLEEKK